MRSLAFRLLSSRDGAVAPTIALSLTGLIAVGGIAFDYTRMASMDTELQQAADQAALAAAAQLDGQDGACARAAAAASGMVANQTLMANEAGGSRAVTVPNESGCDATGQIRFYQDIGKTQPATDDSNAKFVQVQVDPREAFYALTPIVAALRSGQMVAIAFAGLDSAICKVPPLMLCNPNEGSDPDFTIANYVGKGIRLVANDGGGIYGPGNFGFLDVGAGNGASNLRQVLGRTNVPGDCVSGTGVETEPGNMIAVRDALNTRFDIYDNGLNAACGGGGALCPPSINDRKDLVRKAGGCGFVQNGNGNGWRQADNAYPTATLPTTTNRALTDDEIDSIAPMGYPRDICHAFSVTGSCSGGRVGNGTWDRFAYFKSLAKDSGGGGPTAEYPELATWTTASTAQFNSFMTTHFGTTTPTRYEVYRWEMDNKATRLKTGVNAGSTLTSSSQPVCAPGLGVTPTETQIDRRLLSVAVVNCTAQNVRGHSTNVEVTKWIDIFLVEPAVARTRQAITRTENSDVYVEVIGQTRNATDEGAVQLVKKSIPYLIE